MVIALYIAAGLTLLMLTYSAGRKIGRREGRRLCEAELPIRLRTQYQLEQRCPICDDDSRYPYLQSQDQG